MHYTDFELDLSFESYGKVFVLGKSYITHNCDCGGDLHVHIEYINIADVRDTNDESVILSNEEMNRLENIVAGILEEQSDEQDEDVYSD